MKKKLLSLFLALTLALSLAAPAWAATPEEALDLAELGRAIGDYLRTLPLPARRAFLCRYYYADSLAETARVCGISVPAVKSQLYRTRQGLRTYLEKEGFDI